MRTTCPACRSARVVPYLFGMPGPEMIEQAERGEVVLGGCCMTFDADGGIDDRICQDCRTTFRSRPRRRPALT